MSLDPDNDENVTFRDDVFEREEGMNPNEHPQFERETGEKNREYAQIQEDQKSDEEGDTNGWIPAEYDDELEEELWIYTTD